MQPKNNQDDDANLDALVAAYLEAVERGEQPDRQQLMAAHPVVANELAKFFLDFDRIQATRQQSMPELNSNFVPQHEPKPGAIISERYKLLENIGEGGMGSVWVAEQQQPVKRRVAIKLVKAGMDSKQVLARFEAERQALAVMDHPNIAKVFDGGMTEQGRPYFVMEYVRGIPITAYCDQARLSLKDRLNLFIPVCQAVQHAHHKGIVHRDLKPSNILICLYDGKPVPKVIDFGLAKAMHQSLTEQSIYTGHGIMVGTPLYMSPEQAEHNNLDVDTRTDIYSLGVVLYELLVGTTPLERDQLRKAAVDEVLRLIREVEPPRPSVRLSSSASLPSIAAQRSIDPKQLSRSLAGDLDWIVMKSLEKERTRRYETATGLARDIERFLNDEAVEACPPSRSYRLKKFVRKHRGKVFAASLVFLAVFVGVTGAMWGWFLATKAKAAASKSEQRALEALGDVTKERNAKVDALNAETTQREQAERQFINGLLRAIGYGDEPDTAEFRSYIDWSAIPNTHLKLRVLEAAFEDPEAALRVARRAERVIQACVGLSPNRRGQAIDLVSAKQRDMTADPRIRIAACWLAMELASADTPALAESISYFQIDGTQNPEKRDMRKRFCEFMGFAAKRNEFLSPDDIARGGRAIIAVLENKSTDLESLIAAEEGLLAFAPRLTEDQVNLGWDSIIGVLENSTEYWVPQAAVSCLVTLAKQLTPDEVTRQGDAVIAVLENTNDKYAFRAAENGLVILAPRLSKEQLSRGADAILSALRKTTDDLALQTQINGVAALAPKLAQDQVTRGWDLIIAVLEKSTEYYTKKAAGIGLVALAPRLAQDQVTRGGRRLVAVLEKATSWRTLQVACDGLVALAPRLATDELIRGGDAFILVLEKTTVREAVRAAENGLSEFAPRLTPDQVTRGWHALIEVQAKATDWETLKAASDGLSVLAPRLAADQVTHGWDAQIAVLEKSTDGEMLDAAGISMAALAPRLAPDQVNRGWDAQIAVLEKSTDGEMLDAAGDGLVALAPSLPAPRGVDSLIAVIEKSTEEVAVSAAINGLVALGPRLGVDQVPRVGDAIIMVLERPTHWYDMPAAVNGLVSLAPRLSSDQVTRGLDALIVFLEQTTEYDALEVTGNGLAALAHRLAPERRIRTAEALVESLHKIESRHRATRSSRPYSGHMAEHLATVVVLLELKASVQISTSAMTMLLDYVSSSSTYYAYNTLDPFGNYATVGQISLALSSERSLAQLLSHPGCVDEPREFLLQRFEELVLHDGKHVFLKMPNSDEEEKTSRLADAGGSSREGSPPRRFHNLHAAAAWIQQNWPNFDLEFTHSVIWRGER